MDKFVQEKNVTDTVSKYIFYESNWKAISKFRPQTRLLHSMKSFEDMYSVLSNAQSIVKKKKTNLHREHNSLPVRGFKSLFILEQRTLQNEAWLDFPSCPWKFRSHFSFNCTGFSRTVNRSIMTRSRYKHDCEAAMPTASSKVPAINHHSACWIPIMHCLFLNYRNE